MEIKRYEINENIARSAKEMNSFSDYEDNEATNHYNNLLKRFEEDVEEFKSKSKNKITPEIEEAIEYYSNRYSFKLAEAINKENSIDARCPSVMISGAGNFNVRAKEKQNKARESFWEKYGDLYNENNYYLRKIINILNNTTIYSNDDLAIEKLEDKIKSLEELQSFMKSVNAYYKKHGNLEDYELLSEDEIEQFKNKMEMFSYYGQPYPSFELTNNNANIRRLKERVEELKKMKARAEIKDEDKYIKIDGLKVVEDTTDMRIRILFDEIPDAKTRDLLKHWGFRWSPYNSAWQRQLNANGIWTTKRVLEELKEKQ